MELRKNFNLKIWLVGLIFVLWYSSVKFALAADIYEPDNTYGQANTITTDGVVQTHDFDPADEDWVKFSAVGGTNYKIATSNLGENCDTYIYLLDTDGTTVLNEDDDSRVEPFASQIIWTATGPGTYSYYVRARHFDYSVEGSGTNYDISITTFTPGSISGTVTNMSGTPLSGIKITVYDSEWYPIGFDTTDTDGNYSIGKLATGSYYLNANDTNGVYVSDGIYVSEYYNDITEMFKSTPVTVTEGEDTPNINFALVVRGSITGTVTNMSGTPLSDVWIIVYDPNWDQVGIDITDINGNYSVGELVTGNYYIQAWDLNEVYKYYDDVPVRSEANPVSVSEGQETPNINFALTTSSSISGTVTNIAGGPLSNIVIEIYDSDWEKVIGGVFTDTSGNYSIGWWLAPGNYYIEVRDQYKVYATEYYDDAIVRSRATPVNITEGEDINNIDFALVAGGSISGTVTTMSGTPLPYIDIDIYDSDWDRVGWDNTDTDGNYSIGKLATGSYYVKAWDPNGGHIGEYYNDMTEQSEANSVSVTQGEETSNINFALSPAGWISGTVTDKDGFPLCCIDIYVYDSDWDQVGLGTTDMKGNYSVGELVTENYYVKAQDCVRGLYAAEYYDDIIDYHDATPAGVNIGENTSSINFELVAGGSISGTISYSGSTTGLIFVGAFPINSYTPFRATSIVLIGSFDQYSLEGIASGEWYVAAFMDVNGDNNYDSGEPFGEYIYNPVSVIAGSYTPNIDIVLNGEAIFWGGEEETGCSCVTISPASSESLRTEQMIGFLLPFFMVFLTIIAMIRGRKRTENNDSGAV
jgi:hypothetical protein